MFSKLLKLFKRVNEPEKIPDDLALNATKEPILNAENIEIWQWQINCVERRYGYPSPPMPQNFGLLIGTKKDAEERLKECIKLPGYYKTQIRFSDRFDVYEFTDPECETDINAVWQRGAIRCVSENMMLIRQWFGAPIAPNPKAPFIVEETNYRPNAFQFHPIKPQPHFIKGERSSNEQD